MGRHARLLVLVAGVLAAHCGSQSPSTPTGPSVPVDPVPGPSVPPPPVPSGPQVFVGAGDIGQCGGRSEATAKLLDTIGGTIFAAGDLAYPSGTRQEFRDCYDPTWGRHKGRTYAVPGNHEYVSPGAAPFYEYFGLNAGPAGLGYFSFELGAWHIIGMNSNISADASSDQIAWLRADLAASRTKCVLAFWHHPMFSSGPNDNAQHMREAWRVLYDANADLIINGHDHLYERFGLQNPGGAADAARGIRQFVVGTGGADLYGVARIQPNSEVRLSAHGVLKLTLQTDAYDWDFVPISGTHDTGHGTCH